MCIPGSLLLFSVKIFEIDVTEVDTQNNKICSLWPIYIHVNPVSFIMWTPRFPFVFPQFISNCVVTWTMCAWRYPANGYGGFSFQKSDFCLFSANLWFQPSFLSLSGVKYWVLLLWTDRHAVHSIEIRPSRCKHTGSVFVWEWPQFRRVLSPNLH